MLPKSQRLNLKKDFKWVAGGKKLDTIYLKLFVRFRDNQMPMVGIAVSSQVFKKAVERNRARRLTSAVFEALYSTLPQGINILALPKAGMLKVKSGDLLLDLEEGLEREGILRYKDTGSGTS
ncbi:ribonuclease P protein component [Candidatus Daviesbacteria bacterium RIFCSPHIGHO2_01_FULL_40_11]|uniref:Ribonuclease P protein component n=1 Tax=Candidatus Daviesbacteria bacterium RIFCSPHIGHO2_01_FULL_40_11 TaxID=1797762 RepID=A0A1F5JI78_9BACT|nr:MAG: ribonuclease P protein component [Candidatus Daviesbacteria bacterium RIFCSPHIGHO2_01_FULL_40_11]